MSSNFSSVKLKERASSLKQEHKLLIKKLNRLSPDTVDALFSKAHDAEFETFDCLTCANCCKTISPMISYRDVERMAKGIGIKPSAVVEQYLTIDNDGDYVFRTSPCPFLLESNHCTIYEHRPKACREYPHTDRRRMHQILGITQKNISICPVVFAVIERIRNEIK